MPPPSDVIDQIVGKNPCKQRSIILNRQEQNFFLKETGSTVREKSEV